ncbi:MAG: hypothetical protein ACPG5B_15930 [Chitinophagales bacterium]
MKNPIQFEDEKHKTSYEELLDLFENLKKRGGSAEKFWEDWVQKKGIKFFSKTSISNTKRGKTNAMKVRQLGVHLKKYLVFLDKTNKNTTNETQLEEDVKTTNKTSDSYSIDMSEKLALYCNQSFYLYFYDALVSQKEGVLARAILHIEDFQNKYEASVRLVNSGKGTHYRGTVKLHVTKNYLIFRLQTEKTKEKNLHINVIIKPQRVSEIAVGVYCNIDDAGALRAGSLILTHFKGSDTKKMKAISLPKNAEAFQKLDCNIPLFLEKKELNYLKVTKGIYTFEGLQAFFDKQNNKKLQAKQENMSINHIFLAAPMYSLTDNSALNYIDFRKDMLEVTTKLKNVLSCEVHYAGHNQATENDFLHPPYALKQSLEKLDKTDAFVLIYPAALPSSILVETGWALATNKTCLFFVHQAVELPYMLRQCSEYAKAKVTIVKYSENQEILDFIEKHEAHLF